MQCPHYGEQTDITKRGKHSSRPHQQRYYCWRCQRGFDDLTGTILAKHQQPLRVWIMCLYLLGLNLSNAQIAQELAVPPSDAQEMTEALLAPLTKIGLPTARLCLDGAGDVAFLAPAGTGSRTHRQVAGLAGGGMGHGAQRSAAPHAASAADACSVVHHEPTARGKPGNGDGGAGVSWRERAHVDGGVAVSVGRCCGVGRRRRALGCHRVGVRRWEDCRILLHIRKAGVKLRPCS